jgi:hypothetical protein
MNDQQDRPTPADPRHERLVALLYGELSSAEAEALRLEIDRDPGLGRDWEEIRSAREALGSLPDVEPIPGASWDAMDGAFVRRPASGLGRRPIASLRSNARPRARIRDRIRRLLAGPAWGAAAAALVLLVLGLARFRVERVDHGFAFTVGAGSAELESTRGIARGGPGPAPAGNRGPLGDVAGLTGTVAGGEIGTVRSASYVTREELRGFATDLSRNLAVVLDQRAGQRDADMAAWMQTAFQEISRRQTAGYGDLRGRIEQVGIGLARGQYDANERINLLLREDREQPDSPALVPVNQKGEIPR